ncbi:MAG: alginate O-acetyltransferase AlgX-related protein [Planctomycetota bacterium]
MSWRKNSRSASSESANSQSANSELANSESAKSELAKSESARGKSTREAAVAALAKVARPPLGARVRVFALKMLFSTSLMAVFLEGGLRLAGIRPVSASVPQRDVSELCEDAGVAEAQRRGWIPWPTAVQSATRIPEHPRGYVEIRRNRQSLREDGEVALQAPMGTRRIVCVGDSHTDGVCWNEESYPNRLESLLNSTGVSGGQDTRGNVETLPDSKTTRDRKARLDNKTPPDRKDSPDREVARGTANSTMWPKQKRMDPDGLAADRRFDVVNAGFGPSSPYQQFWAYDRVHRRFRPDLLVVSFYAGNDLADLMRTDLPVRLERREGWLEHAESAATAPAMESAKNRSWLESLKQPLRDYSSTYHALTRVSWLRRAVVRYVGMGDSYFDRIEYAALAHAGPVWQGLNQAYYFHHHPQDWHEAVERERWVLERFQELAAADGVPLRLVLIPTLRMIHPETDAESLADAIRVLKLDTAASEADTRAYEAVQELAKDLAIETLDLRAVFQQRRVEHPDEPLFFRFDHHLNTRANELIAAELAVDIPRILRLKMESSEP